MENKPAIDLRIFDKTAVLADLCDYAEGSVISRTLMNKPAGTVTLFSFFEGQGLSEHTAPYDAMVLILDGKSEITIGGTPHILSSGETVVMPANIPHSLKAINNFKMLLIMIKAV